MKLKSTASHAIYAGDRLVLCNDGKVKAARCDMSKKTRFFRWIGRVLNIYRLQEYGYDNDYIVGIAIQDSTPDENKGIHLVEIQVNY